MKLTRTGEVRAIAAALSAGRVEGTCGGGIGGGGGGGAGACAAAGVVEQAVEGVIKGRADRAERESAAACAVGAEVAEAFGLERGSLLAKRIGLAVFRADAAAAPAAAAPLPEPSPRPESDLDPERFDEMTGPWGRGG